jgi:hypothetical protein
VPKREFIVSPFFLLGELRERGDGNMQYERVFDKLWAITCQRTISVASVVKTGVEISNTMRGL